MVRTDVLIERLSSPNVGGALVTPRGVMLHSTRSGKDNTPQEEYNGTVNWFMNKWGKSDASSHALVGHDRIALLVPLTRQAYHAKENNSTHLSIEFVQAKTTTPYVGFQYDVGAWLTRLWCGEFGIPMERVLSQYKRGIISHDDSEQGKRDGKSDVGKSFDWRKFMESVTNMDAEKEKQITEHLNMMWGYKEHLRHTVLLLGHAVDRMNEAVGALDERILAIKKLVVEGS